MLLTGFIAHNITFINSLTVICFIVIILANTKDKRTITLTDNNSMHSLSDYV